MSGAATILHGRLVFSDTESPLHNQDLEVWTRHVILPDSRLGSGSTGLDGCFAIPLEGDMPALIGEVELELRLFRTVRTYAADGSPQDASEEWHRVKVVDEEGADGLDVGTVPVALWPYMADSTVARAAELPDGDLPQEQADEVKSETTKYKIKYGAQFAKHFVASKFDDDWPKVETVQEDYPESLTMEVDAKHSGYSRSDEWLGLRAMNGFNPLLMGRDATDPERWRYKLEWGDVPADGVHDLTDVDASFAVRDGRFVPVRITLGIRTPAKGGGWEPVDPVTFEPDDGPKWMEAKRVFRVQYLLHGETDTHIGTAHLCVEQYAIAAHRNLRSNPLRHLLFPHLEEIVPTNKEADSMAWGPPSTTAKDSALDADEIMRRVERKQSDMDWTGWKPRAPYHDTHTYARAGAIFWDVLSKYVAGFFDEHGKEIAEHWAEVRRFSDDLVAHSVPYEKKRQDPDIHYDDPNEQDDPSIPRVEVGGVLRALRPVTTTDADPTTEDLENLQQLCRYVIYHATFWHAWVHDRQYEDGGEILYSTLSLRGGSLGPENDTAISPKPVRASFGVLTIAVGCAVKYGYILADEEHNIPPAFARLLDARRADFEALGFDISKIRSRINI